MKTLSNSVIELMTIYFENSAASEGVSVEEYIKIVLGSKSYIEDYLDNLAVIFKNFKESENNTKFLPLSVNEFQDIVVKSINELTDYMEHLDT